MADNVYLPTQYFPVSKEMLEGLEIGEVITVTVTGKLTALEAREEDRNEIQLELHEVQTPETNTFSKMADEMTEEEDS